MEDMNLEDGLGGVHVLGMTAQQKPTCGATGQHRGGTAGGYRAGMYML